MNAEKLAQYVTWLTTDEATFDIQEHLSALDTSLKNLVSNPQASQYQTDVVEKLHLLEVEVNRCRATYDEVQWKGVESIGAGDFFSNLMVNQIKDRISGNAMTPSIAQAYVSEVLALRKAYLSGITDLKEGLDLIGIKPLSSNEPEIGFQIPRSIFGNNLEGLTIELRNIRRIINAFAEVTSGSAEEIKVNQISSSDPTFYFGIPAATITVIGYAVSWALDQWKKVEDIRKVRADARKIPSFTTDDIEKVFDGKIKDLVVNAVEEKVSELVGPIGSTGRKAEQRKLLSWAHEALLARIERGMIVEIRLPPEDLSSGEADDVSDEPENPQLVELRKLKSDLVYPVIDQDPVLNLPVYNDEGASKKAPSPKKEPNL